MTLKWKAGEGKYAGKESVMWFIFVKEGDIGLVSKFKDENGYMKDGQTAILDGYEYKTKTVKKDVEGQTKYYHFVERKKVEATGDPIIDTLPSSEEKEAHKSVVHYSPDKDVERQARIDKAHQENLEVQKRQAQALENLNETMTAILQVLRELRATQPA